MSKIKYTLNKTSVGLLKNKVVIPTDQKEEALMAGTVQVHLMEWGYMLTEKAFQALEDAPQDFIIDFYTDAIAFFAESRGGVHNYQPLFKGFPEEVIDASDFKLLRTRMGHYWTNGLWSPGEKSKYKKPIEFEHTKFEMVDLADEEEFKQIFTQLAASGNSLSPVDFAIIEWFAENYDDLTLPDPIPFKENLCALASLGLDVPVNTTKDVLRIATYLSGGDISLPSLPWKTLRKGSSEVPNPTREEFEFKKFKRPERRYLLSLLEKTHCRAEEMVLNKGRWIRLGEILHPGEYANKFPRAAKAFDRLRNEKVTSWYGKLEQAFDKNLTTGLAVVSQRPGEFARRLDAILRHYPSSSEQDQILDKFEEVADRVSNKVLFELLEHFEKRTVKFDRKIMVKGGRKQISLPELKPFSDELVEKVSKTIRDIFRTKFKALDSVGSVFIDPELKKIGLPKNMRSLSPSLKPVIRGQRLPFELKGNLKTVRAFIHWFNPGDKGHHDIDLSGIIFDKNAKNIVHVGWNGKYNTDGSCVYSGDVTNRTGACAEYIDFNVDALVLQGFDYAVIDVRDYARRPDGIAGYQDCVFGVMERTRPKANSTWKPDSISNAHQITTPSTGVLVAGIDLKSREYFMIDLDRDGNTAKSDIHGLIDTALNVAEEPDFSVYDLLEMHAESRGEITEDKDQAETVWAFDDFMVSYEKTMEFMGV